ncbi:MAG: hypothetical protein KGJ86_09860, partial [Chloroflexota bacterium]|nr:hypothetical protein [Chloroflexota bacterium]
MKRSASVQDTTLAVQDIDDGVLHLGSDQYRSVLEVSSLNFSLKSETEQEGVLDSYAAFLNGLNFPVQVLVRVLPVDTERYLAELAERSRRDPSPALADLGRDHVAFVRRLARTRTLLERRFYTVVPAESQASRARRWHLWPFQGRQAESVTPGGIRQQLTYRSDEVARQLGRCDLQARRLDDVELAQLSYSCLCPELAQTQRLRRELADYTTLVVTADRRGVPVETKASRGEANAA